MRAIDADSFKLSINTDKFAGFLMAQIIDMQPTIDTKPQWIPCEKRLPQDDAMMLVTCRTKRGVLSVNRAYYSKGCWHGSGSMSGVIAWMHLPEPYNQDGIEQEK